VTTKTFAGVAADEAKLADQLAETRRRRQELERQAAGKAAADRLAVYQRTLDEYDPAALRRAVVDAWAACRLAAAGDDPAGLSTRITRYLAAIMREWRQGAMANTAIALGAVTDRKLAIPGIGLDAYGSPVPEDVQSAIPGFYAQAIFEAADKPSREEVAGIEQAAEDAYQAALLAQPTGYRVAAPLLGDRLDTIAGHTIVFVGGVAYAMREDIGDEPLASLVRYWRSLPETYDVHEVYGGVPEDHRSGLRWVA
jgi:hypothetical protein